MPALCNSTPRSFKDDKSQQEGKMKQRWFLVVFCSSLEAFHLQDFISLYGERLSLELALVPLVILPLLKTFGKREGWERCIPCALQKMDLQNLYIFTPCIQNVATPWDLSLGRFQRHTSISYRNLQLLPASLRVLFLSWALTSSGVFPPQHLQPFLTSSQILVPPRNWSLTEQRALSPSSSWLFFFFFLWASL